jgi:hypothetical protein
VSVETRYYSARPVRVAVWTPGDAGSLVDVAELLGYAPDVADDGSFTFDGVGGPVAVLPGQVLYQDEFGLGARDPVRAREFLTSDPRVA